LSGGRSSSDHRMPIKIIKIIFAIAGRIDGSFFMNSFFFTNNSIIDPVSHNKTNAAKTIFSKLHIILQ
jgi:hypothetical protein